MTTQQTQVTNDQLFQEAREWFNSMNSDSRNQMILVLYKLCLSTRDLSHEKLIGALNLQWNDKISKQIELNKRLTMENEILSKNQELGINAVVNKINQMEYNLSKSINTTSSEIIGLSSKITPSANGKIGEDYIDQLLSKIPNASFTNITQSKGGGDFLLVLDDIHIMIESKNWTDSSIKGNPKEIENFRKIAIEAKEEKGIDFAIMALHRVTSLKGKPMEIETEITKKGSLILLYITNIFNHPERILYAIDAGILLLKQQSKYNVDKNKFVYQINSFLKGIELLDESTKERQKIIRDLTSITKKDIDQIMLLHNMLNNILNNTEQISIENKLINYYIELSKNCTCRVTKSMLETKCLQNKIPSRHVRLMGGIKTIKQNALKIFHKDIDIDEDEDEDETNEEETDEESDSLEEKALI